VAKHKVYFEPIGIEIEADEDENVLEESFRQGIMLMHGCKEGQCSACKALVLEGDVEMDKYSTFALAEYESDEGYVLLCRAHAYSDLEIELIHFEEHMLESGVPIQTVQAEVVEIALLTHDIRRVVLKLVDPPEMAWITGQYVEIGIPGTDETRSYSIANVGTAVPAARGDILELMIRLYPGGRFSSLLLEGDLKVGDRLEVTGPYGTFTLRENSDRDMIFIGGGAGMAPLWALLSYMAAHGIDRKVTYYYGARTRKDLFYLDELQEMSERLPGLRFVPALSEAGPEDEWDGETGLITDVVDRLEGDLTGVEAYLCGPPPMIDAAIPLLERKGVSYSDLFYDKFTTSVPLEEGEEVTTGPTKGPLDQILARLRTRVATARGEVEVAAEEVEKLGEALESAQDTIPLDKEGVQEDFQEAREALESVEDRLAGHQGEPSIQEGGHSTDNTN
jgi:propane monooxygenase reductase subunit